MRIQKGSQQAKLVIRLSQMAMHASGLFRDNWVAYGGSTLRTSVDYDREFSDERLLGLCQVLVTVLERQTDLNDKEKRDIREFIDTFGSRGQDQKG